MDLSRTLRTIGVDLTHSFRTILVYRRSGHDLFFKMCTSLAFFSLE